MPKVGMAPIRRKQLIDATYVVRHRDGIDSLTLKKIAVEPGVATSIITHYFGTKEALIADTMSDLVGSLLRLGEVSIGGKKVGFVTAGSWSPYLEQGIAIVRLDGAMAAGTAVEVLCRDGKTHAAVLDIMPLYDKEKKIPRGLEPSVPVRAAAE